MNALVFDIESISDLALQVSKSLIERNEQSNKIEDEEAGPLALASALSDFFQMAAALENGSAALESSDLSDFAEYGLDLFDRLAYQLLVLEAMEHRETMARIYASIAVWFSRRGVVLNNLEGIADGFGRLTNGLREPGELAEMCGFMEEVAGACSDELQSDDDSSNPYRPWRVLNLNAGIAATRSLDAELMRQTFDNLGRRLPDDMPGFLADGKRQIAVQDVPDPVRETMERYAEKWPAKPLH